MPRLDEDFVMHSSIVKDDSKLAKQKLRKIQPKAALLLKEIEKYRKVGFIIALLPRVNSLTHPNIQF